MKIKDLKPSQMRAIAKWLYLKKAEKQGVKLCGRHIERIENGLIKQIAYETKYGKGREGEINYRELMAETFWWHGEVFAENITRDFTLFRLLGDKDLSPKIFKMR